MSVVFPKKSGPLQKLVRFITEKLNKLSEQFDSKLDSIKDSVKDKYKDKFKFEIKSLFESPKFEPLKSYIENKYPNGVHISDESEDIMATVDCEVAMKKIQAKIDELTKLIESKFGEIDLMLEPIKELLESIQTYLGLIQNLMNASISIDTVVSIVTDLIKLVAWMFGMMLKPYIEQIDQLYKGYRDVKVTAGAEIFKLTSILQSKCIIDCKYRLTQPMCPVLKKLKLTVCPLHTVIGSLKNIVEQIPSGIDTITLPIDELLKIIDSIVSATPVNKVINRSYPPAKLIQVIAALAELSSNSQLSKSGIVTQPPVSDYMKVDSKAD